MPWVCREPDATHPCRWKESLPACTGGQVCSEGSCITPSVIVTPPAGLSGPEGVPLSALFVFAPDSSSYILSVVEWPFLNAPGVTERRVTWTPARSELGRRGAVSL